MYTAEHDRTPGARTHAAVGALVSAQVADAPDGQDHDHPLCLATLELAAACARAAAVLDSLASTEDEVLDALAAVCLQVAAVCRGTGMSSDHVIPDRGMRQGGDPGLLMQTAAGEVADQVARVLREDEPGVAAVRQARIARSLRSVLSAAGRAAELIGCSLQQVLVRMDDDATSD